MLRLGCRSPSSHIPTAACRGCAVTRTAPRHATGITPCCWQHLSCNVAAHTLCIRCSCHRLYQVAFTCRMLTHIPQLDPMSLSSQPQVPALFLLLHPKYPQPQDAISSFFPPNQLCATTEISGAWDRGQGRTHCHNVTVAELGRFQSFPMNCRTQPWCRAYLERIQDSAIVVDHDGVSLFPFQPGGTLQPGMNPI